MAANGYCAWYFRTASSVDACNTIFAITKIVYPRLLLWFSGRLDLSMVGVTLGFCSLFLLGDFYTCIHDYINYRTETLVGRRKWIIMQKLLLRDGIYCKFSLKSIDKLNILRVLTRILFITVVVQVHSLALHAFAIQPGMLYLSNLC